MPEATAIKTRRAARAAKDGDTVDHLARLGLVALGIVHVLVGWLALQLALGGGGSDQADNQGALRELAGTTLGGPLLWLIVVGFAGLVLWQLTEAAVGHTDEEDAKRTAKRVLSVGKAIVYGSLGWSAAKIASGGGSGSSDSSGESFTARLMSAPAGQVLVALVGLAIIGGGVYFIRKGVKKTFTKKLEGGASTGLIRLGVAGHTAKGVAYGVLGILFVTAAIEHDPKKSGGLDDALKTLLDQPAGSVLVVLVGLGIAAYGVYCFGWARHMRKA